MATIDLKRDSANDRRPATYQIFYKNDWLDPDWTEIQADSLSLSEAVAPSFGKAEFIIRNGKLMFPGDTDFANVAVDVEDLNGKFVKIELTFEKKFGAEPDPMKWYGVMTSAQQTIIGESGAEDWRITCLDFKWLLGRKQITKSKVIENGAEIEIERALTFNTPWGDSNDKNQTEIGNYDSGNLVFAEERVTSTKWNGVNMLDYLFSNYAPNDGAFTWEYESPLQDSLLWHEPVIEQQGKTLFEIINAIINRRRGITWILDVQENTVDPSLSKVVLKVQSYLNQDVVLQSGETVYANPTINDWDFMDQSHVNSVTRTISKQEHYHQVHVRGLRRVFVTTLNFTDDLVKDWSTQDEQDYADAANGSTGYINLNLAEKRQRNDSRRSENPLKKVYSRFKIKDGWTAPVHIGATWKNGIRFLPQLPMFENVDYSSISSPVVGDGGEGDPISPLVSVQLGLISLRERVENLKSSAFLELYGQGVNWACYVRMIEGGPVFEVMPTAAPHVFGEGHYDENTSEPSSYYPTFDYTTIKATVAFELDRFVEGFFPSSPPLTGDHNEVSVLTIDVGARAQRIDVDGSTTYAIEDGEEKTTTLGALRDDTNLCEDLASLAYEYYGTPRQAINVILDYVTSEIRAGHLLGTFHRSTDTYTVNSLVTSVTWDVEGGRVEISTDFAELDFVNAI